MTDFNDAPFDGDYEELTCPYCYKSIIEVWDYGLKLYAEDANAYEHPHTDSNTYADTAFGVVLRGRGDRQRTPGRRV